MSTVKGRFAPSPSGRMHLGNIFTALISWLSAKRQGGTWLLRIEDLDPQRSKREHAERICDDLLWLGLEWDEGGLDGRGDAGPYLQSARGDIYERMLARIKETGLAYPCRCTRADLMATQAPHQSDGRAVYGGRCRPARLPAPYPEGAPGAVRLSVPDRDFRFTDRLQGAQSVNLAHESGDFVLRRADGAWSYQLAVVVDDALMGVTEVVRGADLMLSVGQQMYLRELLGFREPAYMHLPLLCNGEGRRLSKRDSSLSMEALRRDYTPESLTGHIAHIAGLIPEARPLAAADLLRMPLSLPRSGELRVGC